MTRSRFLPEVVVRPGSTRLVAYSMKWFLALRELSEMYRIVRRFIIFLTLAA
jgi:hypothetical protein